MDDQLSRVLEPESIAIVGASDEPTKRGYSAIKNLQDSGYAGDIFSVNPSQSGKIRGTEVYSSVSEIPTRIDLAFVVTPASTIPAIIEECGDADVAGAVVIAAGFSEVGAHDLEADVVTAAREGGVRLIGPNVLGIVNTYKNVDLGAGYDFPRGGAALLSQSGNFGAALSLDAERFDSAGFSFFISIGNESDVEFHEYLPYLSDHSETEVIVSYVEGMADGRAFLREASEFTREKPIVVIKGGMTNAGKRSARSHTASLAGNEAVISDVYEQAGIIRVDRSDDLLPVSIALSEAPSMGGENVAVITEGGGHATLASDALSNADMNLPALRSETRSSLEALLPGAPNYENPIDTMLRSDLSLIERSTAEVLSDDTVDGVLICGLFGGYGTDIFEDETVVEREISVGRRLSELSEEYEKPVLLQSEFADRDSAVIEACRKAGLPTFKSIDTAARALKALSTYGTHLQTIDQKSDFQLRAAESSSEQLASFLETSDQRLSEYQSREVLAEYDVPMGDYNLATAPPEAIEYAAKYEEPVAMKIVSRDIQHKSDIGGVMLNIESEAEVEEAFEEITQNVSERNPDANVDGVLITPMLDDGLEVIVGVTNDPEIGPVLMFGIGGVFVEVLEDVSFKAIPVTRHDARDMVESFDAADVLHGARGKSAVDVDSLVDLLVRTSEIVVANPEIEELELNPVRVWDDGIQIVDASIHLSD